MTLRDWGIIYGMVLSTAALLGHGWNLWSWWRDRERVDIKILEFGQGFGANGGFLSYLSISIKNRSPKPVYIENIGYTDSKGRDQPMFAPAIPSEIDGFRTIKFPFWEGLRIADGAIQIFAIDGRGKKHLAEAPQVARAVILAKQAKETCDNHDISTHEYLERRPNFPVQ